WFARKRAYCLKTQPATGETYPKSDLFNKADHFHKVTEKAPRGTIGINVPFIPTGKGLNI
ncbi:hypothetical protein M1V68_25950, partial [Klebsiella pneumoniae]|nr:hypothetical protein [Klebsiella pneumoniae]